MAVANGRRKRWPEAQRQSVEETSQSQTLPSLRHILTTPSRAYALEAERAGPARLIKAGSASYIHEGPFKFLAPYPSRDFPTSVSTDARELSFATVEPELMETFRRAWYLRHYIRLKRLQSEHWNDHIYFNDCFGIETILYTWASRYEPGTLQYPASMLYKHCAWLFFNRTVQVSQPSPAFAQVVEDGLHFLRTIENALGPAGDRSILLIPLFLLGICAFYSEQKREVWEALDRLDSAYTADSVNHAGKSLDRIWTMMEDGRMSLTWDWERYQAHDSIMASGERSLIDLLYDPLIPVSQTSRVRSPDTYEFDPSRFRAAPAQAPPPAPPEAMRNQREEGDPYTPPRTRSPIRHHSTASIDAADLRADGHPDTNQGHVEIAAGPRPFLAPPPPQANLQYNSDVIQVLHRKSKAKSNVPPCPVCGKHLKNPSDAQKHELQHTKPFLCREPGCSRAQGFATENDLQRHRKSVHGASPRIGNKIGYVCAACPEPSDGTARKWWPRLDNFKAHIRRKHMDQDEEALIQASASPRRPGDESYSEPSHLSSSLRWPEERHHDQYSRRSTIDESSAEQDHDATPVAHNSAERMQMHAENSDHASVSPKSEGSLSASGSGSGSDPMEVTPTGEGEQEREQKPE